MGKMVYVYDGTGASPLATQLLVSSLQNSLDPRVYKVERITPSQIRQGQWQENCAALFFGGGYDLGFIKALGDEGSQRIRDYVMQGGTYFGFCAGAYFACDYIEFEKGSKIEVCGHRPLKFYPGKCIGCIVPGFKYDSERGAGAVPLTVSPGVLPGKSRTHTLHSYVNGGGYFSPYASFDQFPDIQKVENVATFSELPNQPPAVVKTSVGSNGGTAILSSPHMEFAPFELNPADQYLMKIQRELRNSDRMREWFFKSLLREGGLSVRMPSLL